MTPEANSGDDYTFEAWISISQGLDPTALSPDESAMWRRDFEELRRSATPKVNWMKLRPPPPGEHRYAVAIRDNSGLWLTLWVRRNPKGEFFVMAPRAKEGWDPHVSYHLDGTFHSKSFDRKQLTQKRQPLTGPFKGTEHLGAHAGHGVSIGALCDPAVFTNVVEVAPDVLNHDSQVVVDLVEPRQEPLSWPGELVKKEVFEDATPWVVIRIIRQQLLGDTHTITDSSKLVDQLSNLTVLEAAELAKLLEEKWLVSAAVAVSGGAGTAAVAPAAQREQA